MQLPREFFFRASAPAWQSALAGRGGAGTAAGVNEIHAEPYLRHAHASPSRSSTRPSAMSTATRQGPRCPRRRGAGAGRDLVMFPELFLAGYPPEDLVLKPAFQEACRTACEALARETADGGPAVLLGLPWAEGGKLYNAYALLDGGADRRRALQGRPAELRRLRREARLRRRAAAGADRSSAALRIGVPICEDIWTDDGGRMPGRDRRRDPAGAQRLALLARQDGRAPQHRRRARHRRAGCRSSISTRSAGRTSSSSTAPPSSSTPTARWPRSCPPSARRLAITTLAARALAAGAAPTARRCCGEEGDEADYAACVLGLRTMSRRTAFPAWCWACPAASIPRSAPRWRSMRWARTGSIASCCPIRYTSQREPRRRGGLRRGARRALRHRADRPGGRGLRGVPRAAVRRAAARHHRGEPAEPRSRHDPDVRSPTSSGRWW